VWESGNERVAKARLVRLAIMKDGWVQVASRGSHFKLRKGGRTRTFAFHDNVDLGKSALEAVAKTFGYDLEALRRML
jgi:predicted RNA binding protein YcfA (HicA-like mRNA interferase family)